VNSYLQFTVGIDMVLKSGARRSNKIIYKKQRKEKKQGKKYEI